MIYAGGQWPLYGLTLAHQGGRVGMRGPALDPRGWLLTRGPGPALRGGAPPCYPGPMVHDEGRTLEELTRGPWRDAARARLGVLTGGQGPDGPALAPIPAQNSGGGDGATSGWVEGPPSQRGVKREDGPVGAGTIETHTSAQASSTYLEQDEALARLGFHKTSSWHRQVIEAIERARVRRVVLREGRRGGKTTTALRYFIDALVHRVWSIDPGDVGIVAIVSAQKWQSLCA